LLDPALIAENLALVRERVGPDVQILAATKYVDAGDLAALHEGGVRLVGENRSDALIAKQEAHRDLFTWDFIGHVQSRKVRDIAGRVRLIHAIDSMSACRRLQDVEQDTFPIFISGPAQGGCLLQVNVAGEESKSGVPLDEVDRFLEEVSPLEAVRFRGLMTMPPLVDDPDAARAARSAGAGLGGTAQFPGALDGHQPGLRGGCGRGRDDRTGGERPLWAVK
jgi:PLP dependent protein